jgi:hypothetical protein
MVWRSRLSVKFCLLFDFVVFVVDMGGFARVIRISRAVNSHLGNRAATRHASGPEMKRRRLPFGDCEGGFDQIDGIPAGHDPEGARLDNAVHVAIQEGEVVET